MSSFLGIVSGEKELIKKAEKITGSLRPTIQTPFCTIFNDTKSDRLFFSDTWIISGIGIHPYPNTSLLSQSDWDQLFLKSSDKIASLNGHFAGVFIDEQQIELVTDQVGMRSLFVLEVGSSIIFSTRADWLIPFSDLKIDWKFFGENWLSVNPFSGKSLLNGIQRIHSSSKCVIDKNSLSITPKSWTPTPTRIDIEEYLFKLTSAIFSESNSISLGLSGGLDSRLLLAILAGNSEIDFDLYTFSGLDHPDESIARRLNSTLNKPHEFFEHQISEISLDSLAEVAVRSMLTASIPEFHALGLYEQVGGLGKKTIDGAIGEIGRRRFYRNIELRGKTALLQNDIVSLSKLFQAPKADVFSDEINTQMQLGFQESLEQAISKMPDVQSFGVGNWLDLFTIRTRMINIAGMNQELSDTLLFHLMPFVQPDFLNGIFSLPLSERSNAKLFRLIIRKHHTASTKIPLVKSDDEYPFWMNDLTALLWMKTKNKLGWSHKNHFLANVLRTNESQIRDLFQSQSFNQANCYDSRKVSHLIHSFYDDNNYHVASALNWLLTFELFRNRIENEST